MGVLRAVGKGWGGNRRKPRGKDKFQISESEVKSMTRGRNECENKARNKISDIAPGTQTVTNRNISLDKEA